MSTVLSWTGAEARALRDALRLSVRAFAEHLGVAVRTVSKWEAGGLSITPRPDTQSVLDTALSWATTDERERFRQFCADPDRHARSAPAVDVDVLRSAAIGSAELADLAGRTDLRPGSVDEVEQAVHQLAHDYFRTSPEAFRLRALRWQQHVIAILQSRATLRERRRLYGAAGALTGLLAESSLAAGLDARAHCSAALALADEADDLALAGWVRGTQAQVALCAGDPHDAVELATAGCRLSPRGSTALVRCQTYLARASARQGDRNGGRAALVAAEKSWDTLDSARTASIFSLSDGYLAACEMTALVWLGDGREARRHAAATSGPASDSTPTVGRAISQVDLGIALAQTGEVEEAAVVGTRALAICRDRMTVPARQRITELVTVLAPFRVPAVHELRRQWAWISD